MRCSIAMVAMVASAIASGQAYSNVESSSSRTSVEWLNSSIRSSASVEFYFLTRTDGTFSNEQIRTSASTRIYRNCGGNCEQFLAPVIEHLDRARPAPCHDGYQTLMIRLEGGQEIVYSHGGRVIHVNGACFYNSRRIDLIVKREGFFFAPRD